ncbi:MAG: aspartate racemase [Verrucomicrobiota bacterium]|jgi:aspartate racemase
MKTLGIVGGIGPESTIEYYRFILDGYRKRVTEAPTPLELRAGAASVPHIIIDSIDVNRGLAMLDANDLAALADYVAESVERLTRAGAEIGLIAANTPHIVFEEVERRATIPMISLVRATCDRALALGFRKLALLGTGFTMRGRFYPEVFARAGIELITPAEEEKDFIHRAYIGELLKNQFLPETRDRMIAIINRLRAEEGIDAVILAGTELPLLLRGAEPEGLPFLDTTLIHVDAAVEAVLR